MTDLAWILVGGFLMSVVAMVGAVTILLKRSTLERLLLCLVALAAGTLLGGAFFHMMPEGMEAMDFLTGAAWIMGGFSAFLVLEQFLHWHHHGHRATTMDVKPVTYLVLFGDAAHNFLGGIGIASTFLVDARAGITAWIAAVAHEVPQELGDFAVLVHGGWARKRALLWNMISALTFPLGALLAYSVSQRFDVTGLVLFGAGNFMYIAASDLVPEIKEHTSTANMAVRFGCFALGLALMFAIARVFHH